MGLQEPYKLSVGSSLVQLFLRPTQVCQHPELRSDLDDGYEVCLTTLNSTVAARPHGKCHEVLMRWVVGIVRGAANQTELSFIRARLQRRILELRRVGTSTG